MGDGKRANGVNGMSDKTRTFDVADENVRELLSAIIRRRH